jgi:hypothetical protein
MGGDPVEQQVGHRVGLLLEHKVADVVQCLEAVLPGDITSAVLNALLHDRHIVVDPQMPRERQTCCQVTKKACGRGPDVASPAVTASR